MRYRTSFVLMLATITMMSAFADGSLHAQSSHAQSSHARSCGMCPPSHSPFFGIKLVGCQSCTDGCATYPGFADTSANGEAPQEGELSRDLQLNETFAALTSSTFAVSAPNMIGDNLGGPSIPVLLPYYYIGNGSGQPPIEIGSGTGGAVVGRIKLSDNNSPLPRDRVFFDYNYFHNARLIEGGKDVNRFTPGFEKTFLNGLASFEMRVPMLATLNSDVTLDGSGNVVKGHNNEFGNLAMILKGLLWFNESLAVSGGMAITVPTGDDIHIRTTFGDELMRIQNDAVFLTPYLAFLCTPNDTFFYQGFLGVDVATNGNRVSLDPFGQSQLTPVGRFRDQTLLMVDMAAGAWLFRDRFADRGLSGLAAVVEVHYNQTLDSMDAIDVQDFRMGRTATTESTSRSFVNMTVGATAVFGQRTMFTVGYGTPVSSDRLFDGELRAFLNRYF